MRRTLIGAVCAFGVTAALFPSGLCARPAAAVTSPACAAHQIGGGGRGDGCPAAGNGMVHRKASVHWQRGGQACGFSPTSLGKGPRMVAPVDGNDPIGGANPTGLYRALIYAGAQLRILYRHHRRNSCSCSNGAESSRVKSTRMVARCRTIFWTFLAPIGTATRWANVGDTLVVETAGSLENRGMAR